MIDDRAWGLLTDRLEAIEDTTRETLRQARLTNGHVIDHEHRIRGVERQLNEDEREEIARRAHRFTKLELMAGGAFVLAGGGMSYLLHAIFG